VGFGVCVCCDLQSSDLPLQTGAQIPFLSDRPLIAFPRRLVQYLKSVLGLGAVFNLLSKIVIEVPEKIFSVLEIGLAAGYPFNRLIAQESLALSRQYLLLQIFHVLAKRFHVLL